MSEVKGIGTVRIGGLLEGDSNPYYCIKIPAEKFKEIKNRKVDIYEIDGEVYFDFLDNNGDNVGDKVIFLIWR